MASRERFVSVLIHIANISFRLGRTLNFDSETMRVVGENEANAMLNKEYSKNYEIPDKV